LKRVSLIVLNAIVLYEKKKGRNGTNLKIRNKNLKDQIEEFFLTSYYNI